jgi:hypothetical protein
MNFRIQGLDPEQFRPLFGLSEEKLTENGARRVTVDSKPGYPDRITLTEAEIGESMLLLNFEHLPVETPYRSRHAIFIREGAGIAFNAVNFIPEVIRSRVMSLRAFDSNGFMLDADVIEGSKVEELIDKLFENDAVDYVHAHYAKRGCFACAIHRA